MRCFLAKSLNKILEVGRYRSETTTYCAWGALAVQPPVLVGQYTTGITAHKMSVSPSLTIGKTEPKGVGIGALWSKSREKVAT